jgi:membrane-bound metal-dependent hydrolase YbcI (DUF457 family)
MPLPIAHGLLGATAALALRQSSAHSCKPILIGAFLGICPDFDYGLNWLHIGGGGWHHGFTHSILFAFILGMGGILISGERNLRSLLLFSTAAVTHTLLDYLMTDSHGVALWWPFTNQRYKLRLSNPIDYAWSQTSVLEALVDIMRISLIELLVFLPVLLLVMYIKKEWVKRTVTDAGDA